MKHLLTLLLALAVAATWWLQPPAETTSTTTAVTVDYAITDFYARQTGTDGRTRRILQADRVEHDRTHDQSRLTRPRALLYRGEAPLWLVRADHGLQADDQRRLELSGDVVAHRRGEDENHYTLVESERMLLFPRKEYLETDQPLIISSPSAMLSGVGAQAWLDEGRIKLLSQAVGHYQP